MFKYFQKLLSNLIFTVIVTLSALANWQWPFYVWFGDTTLNRFIWLGIFFILLDIFLEIILNSIRAVRLITEIIGFSNYIHKLSDGFRLLSKITLPNGLKADFLAIGSSGIWLITVKDDGGKVVFNGDDLIQKGQEFKGLIAKVLENSYTLADLLKKRLNRDFKVAPVIAFSSSSADLTSVPKIVRSVYISSRKDINTLIENTDVQLIDRKTADEIYDILKTKNKK